MVDSEGLEVQKNIAYYQQDKLLVIFSFCGGFLLKTSVHTLKKRKSMTETNLTPSELNLLSHFQGLCLCSPQRLRLLKDLAVKVWRMWIFLLAPRPRSSSTTWSWSCRSLCMALKRLPHICQLRVRRHEYLLVSKGDKRQIVGVWGMNALLSINTYNCKRQLWGTVRVDTWKIVMLQDDSLKDVTKTVFYLSNKSINLQRAFWLVVQNCLLKAGLKGTDLSATTTWCCERLLHRDKLKYRTKKVCLINKSLNFNRLGIEVSCCLFWHKEMSSRPAVKLSNITNWNKFSDLCSYCQSVCSARLPNKLPRNVITFMTHKRWILMTLLILNFYVHLRMNTLLLLAACYSTSS